MHAIALGALSRVMWITVAVALSGCGGGSETRTPLPNLGDVIGGDTPTQPVATGQIEREFSLPSDHGLSAGEIALQPAESREQGNVVLTCPAGGSACIVTVAANGTATYRSTGGAPTIMAAQEPWALPPGHDLSAGQITLQPGESEEHGNVVLTCPAGGNACVIAVATDGTATFSTLGGGPTVMPAQEPWAALPFGHDLPAGGITLQPGESRERGNVVLGCPAGGTACVVTVATDGTATYHILGGTPTVMPVQETLVLPPVHGVPAGEITLQPGESREHGNVALTCPVGGNGCVVSVAADGTATYDRTGGMPTFVLVAPEIFPQLPSEHLTDAMRTPIVELDGTLHVGADVAPPAGQLTAGGDYNGVFVSSGWVQDGVGAGRVLEFLDAHLNRGEYRDAPGFAGYSVPPVVRLAEGTGEKFTEYVVRAVQLVNSALPFEKRIAISTEPAPPLTAIENVPDGQIFVDFAPWADWAAPSKPPSGAAIAIAEWHDTSIYNPDRQRLEVQEMRASHIWVDTNVILEAWVFDSDAQEWEEKILESRVEDTDTIVMTQSEHANITTLAHELLHALGFAAHVDPARFMNSSIMNNDDYRERIVRRSGSYGSTTFTIPEHNSIPGHILFPLDREALLAAYSRLQPGTLPEELSVGSLGSWDDQSFHLLGELNFLGGQASFGVASRNGLAQPWASGPTPWTNLADTQVLSGSATWDGALLGISRSPEGETVAGNASLTVELVSLDGQLDFTDMEQWGTNEAPGVAGSGTTWGDGDLEFAIEVHGNTFIQTGGDDGTVTGAFFGAAHEAMGGVLERSDLAAGFGGTR